MPDPDRSALEHELGRLHALDVADLRQEWLRRYKGPLPRLSRNLLVLALCYEVQEGERGGLSKSARAQLQSLIKDQHQSNRARASSGPRLKPGARLIREWHGRMLTVSVTEQGFEYNTTTYHSLTQIARLITGVAWSGPRFFGLRRAQQKSPGGADG